MFSELILRKFNIDQDYRGQRDLFSLAFPETNGGPMASDAHYQWKFQQLPCQPPAYEFVAEQNGDIVGYYAALPFEYQLGTQRKICGMVCDVMTHPKMRGQGVFTKLGRYSTSSLESEGLDFVSGYPIRPEVIPGHLKVGWFVAFKLKMFLKPIRSNSFFKRKWADILIHPILNLILNCIHFLLHLSHSNIYSMKILSRDEFIADNQYDSFRSHWEKSQQNYLIKSKEFIGWRTRAPSAEYFFFVLSKEKDMKAVVLVRKVELKGIPVLAILDWMTLPDVENIGLAQIHKSLLQFARLKSCDAIVGMIGGHWARKYRFLNFGFLPSPAVFSIIFKLLKNDLNVDKFKKSSDWHLMWVDSDDL